MRALRGRGGMVLACLLAAAGIVPAVRGAVPLAEAVAAAEKEAAQRRQDLDETYRRVAAERQQLARESEALSARLEQLRTAAEEAAARQREDTAARSALEEETARLRQVSRLAANLALEYRRSFESRLSVAEVTIAEPGLEAVDRELGTAPETVSAQTLEALLTASLRRSEDALGGCRRPGRVVDAGGRIVEGTCLAFGPLSFFQAAGGRTGLAVQQVGSVYPTLYARFDGAQKAALEELFRTGRASVPVDVTMGSAIRLAGARETLLEHLRKGGIVMVPLLALGALCAAIAVYKLAGSFGLATERCRQRTVEIIEAVNAGDLDRARQLADALGRPLRAVLREGLAHRSAPRERLEEILFERIVAEVPALERFLSTLAVAASAAPLLGLLGTVTGMIHTFRLITVFGTGDARLLSAGISEALITTEAGLCIAIPALLCHAYLSRRIRHTVSMVQEAAVMFVNGVGLRTEAKSG